jgi:hypothetical protein
MARGKRKDPYAELDASFKNSIENMSDEQIKQRVAEINLNLQQLLNAREVDQDLKEKAAAYQEANRVYREGMKDAKLRTKYALSVLEARGKA